MFVSGALIALVLAAPKYSWRQPQIERQFQARERSGRTISARGGPQPLSTTNRPLLSLRPLAILLTAVFVVAGVTFWLVRWKQVKKRASCCSLRIRCPVIAMGLLTVVILLSGFFKTGRVSILWAIAVVMGMTAVMLAVEHFAVTPKEEIEGTLQGIAADLVTQ